MPIFLSSSPAAAKRYFTVSTLRLVPHFGGDYRYRAVNFSRPCCRWLSRVSGREHVLSSMPGCTCQDVSVVICGLLENNVCVFQDVLRFEFALLQ